MTTNYTKDINTGQLLPIMEDFYTIQGEGYHSGTAAYFVRIGGCDVGCHWCDVKESWDANLHPFTPVEPLVEKISQIAKTIVLTGGEPLMWNLDFITKKLKELGCQIHIETSGSHDLSGHFDWICLSPKKKLLPKEGIYTQANELKMIIHNQNDFNFAAEQAAKVNDKCILYLQPEWSKRAVMIPKIVDFVMNNPQWQVSLQTHKYLNIP